jgi:hypothetical protein
MYMRMNDGRAHFKAACSLILFSCTAISGNTHKLVGPSVELDADILHPVIPCDIEQEGGE